MYQTAKLDLIHQKYYLDYFYQLGNIDEYIRLLQDPSRDLSADVTFDQLLTIIKLKEESNKTVNSYDKSIKRIISYAASHFEDINKEKIKILDVDMLYEILNYDDLKISSEDSLLEFILSIYKEDPKYSILFELVLFNNTSQESFEKFINEIEFYDINTSTWHSICSKFNESTKIYNKNSKRYKSHSLD